MFYVYVLIDQEGELYFGSTNNLKRRFKEHNSEKVDSTKGRSWKLLYYEAYFSEQDARARESKLKQFGQSVKHLKNRLKHSITKISAG